MTAFEKGEGKAGQIAVGKREALAAVTDFNAQLDEVLKEFALYYKCDLKVVPSIVPYPDIKHPLHYCVEADMYVNDMLVLLHKIT